MTQPPPWPEQPSTGGGASDPPPQPAPDPAPPPPPQGGPPPSLPPPGAPNQPLYPGASYGAPAAPPPGYGYGYPYQPAPQTNGMAIASMVVSIVSAVGLCAYGLGGFLGILGAILGHVARRQVRTRHESGDGMALSGIIIGWVAAGLAVVIVALFVIFFLVASEPAFQPDEF